MAINLMFIQFNQILSILIGLYYFQKKINQRNYQLTNLKIFKIVMIYIKLKYIN